MTIKMVSQLTGVSADTIRYYEKIGLLPPIKRNAAGVRDFTQRDVDILRFVLMFKKAGFSVEALVEYVKLLQSGESRIEDRIALLIEQRKSLQERIDNLHLAMEHLNYKIDNYESKILPRETELFEADDSNQQ